MISPVLYTLSLALSGINTNVVVELLDVYTATYFAVLYSGRRIKLRVSRWSGYIDPSY